MRMKTKRLTMQPNAHDIETEGLPSASGFDAEFRCRGKRALCAKLPKEKGNVDAARGQRIHDALKDNDLSNLNPTEQTTTSRLMYGESEIVHEFGFEGALVTFEERIWDFDPNLNHTWSARVDRYDWKPVDRRLLVLDDKSGWTLSPAIADNWQVRSEGALLTELLDAEETVVALIHPHDPNSLWEAKVYSRKAMLDLLATVRVLVHEIQQPDQPRTPGGIQCQWCTAKRVCPEYKAWQARLMQDVADEVQDQGFTAINKRSAAERGEHVRALKEQLKHIEFILDQYAELAVNDPNAVAGYRLTRKMTRYLSNEDTAIDLVRKQLGESALAHALKFNIVALESGLADEHGRTKAKDMVRACLASVLRYKPSKYFLDESRSL